MRTYRRKQQPLQVIDGVEELCRLCLNKSDSKEPIYNSQSNDVCSKLSTRITICIGLEVSHDKNLPSTVCKACLKQLEICYTFRKNCEVSYQKLKQHLQAIENQRRCESAVKSEKIDLQTDKSEENTLIFNEDQENNTLNTADDNFTYIFNNSLKSGENEIVYLVNNMDTPITIETNENRIINQLDIEIGELIVADKSNLEIVEGGEDNSLADGKEFQSGAKEDNSTVDGKEALQSVADDHTSFNVDEENTQREEAPTEEPSLDISSYIAKELLDNHIITAASDCLLLSPDMRIVLELLTADGAVVTLQLSEEGDKELHAPISALLGQPAAAAGLVRVSLVKDAKQSSLKDRLVCAVCSRQFSRRSALRRHARVHSGERAHECEHCGRRFAQRAVMLRHATTHQEKRPYPCSTCDKSFTQNGARRAHEASHCPNSARQMTLHACPHCPKLFLYASGLSRHASVHSGRTFPCATCSRTFRDKSSLKRHARLTRHAAHEND